MSVACYPCSIDGHPCVLEEDYVLPARPVPAERSDARPAGRWFDVALWRWFPSLYWPEWVGAVQADDAFSAVVQLMHAVGFSAVDYAAVYALDGSMMYRAYGVRGVKCGLIWFSGRRNADSAAPGASESEEMRSVSN